MREEQKEDIRALIAYYDAHGRDWSNALEYTVRKYNGSLPWQEEWPRRPQGRRRKEQRDA